MVGEIINILGYLESRSETLKANSRERRRRNVEFLRTVSGLLVAVADSSADNSTTVARAELEAYLSDPPRAFLSAVGQAEAKRLGSILLELTEDGEAASAQLLQAAGRLKALSARVDFAEDEELRASSLRRILLAATVASLAAILAAAVFSLILF